MYTPRPFGQLHGSKHPRSVATHRSSLKQTTGHQLKAVAAHGQLTVLKRIVAKAPLNGQLTVRMVTVTKEEKDLMNSPGMTLNLLMAFII